MQDGKAAFAKTHVEVLRQGLHVRHRLRARVLLRERVPDPREDVAATIVVEVAAAVLETVSDVHLDVARDGMNAPVAHEVDTLGRVGAVGHDISGAQGVRSVDAAGFGESRHGLQRL